MFFLIKSNCKSVIKKGYRDSSLKTFQWSFKGECSSAVRDGINQPNLIDINDHHTIIKSFYLPAGPNWPTSIRPHLSTKLEGGSQTSIDSMAVGTRSWFEGMRLLKGRSSRSAQLQKSCNVIIHFFSQKCMYSFGRTFRNFFLGFLRFSKEEIENGVESNIQIIFRMKWTGW